MAAVAPGPHHEYWEAVWAGAFDEHLFTLTGDGTITAANRAWPGLTPAALVGADVAVLGLPRALVERALDGQIGTAAWSVDAGDRRLYFEGTCLPVPVSEGGGARLVLWVRDVTASESARQALAAREARFRALIEHSTDAILLFDGTGVIRYANPAAGRLLDYPPEFFTGVDGWNLMHPDDRAGQAAVLQDILRHPGKAIEGALYRARHRNGEWRYIETVSMNLLGDPAVGAIMAKYRDVTGRVRLEQQLRQAQKMEAIGLLAGGVAHDFNNLITAILGFTHHAATSLPPEHPAIDDLAMVRQAAESAAALTFKLLTFARRQVHVRKVFDLSATLRNFIALVRRIVGEDIELAVDLPDAPVLVDGDPAQIEQVVLNLTTNARQAMPSGGRLRIALRPSADATRCELEVSDTGVGMTPEVRARAFEPFYTARAGGTGLGLSVVFGVVQDHQGGIAIESAPGHGTSVRIDLPLKDGATAADEPPAARSAAGHETVLFAEDEPMVRELVARELERLGYTVIAAADGAEAVRLFDAHQARIDVVVVDVVMPQLGGPEAVAQMRSRAPGVPALFLTGYAPDAQGLVEPLAAADTRLLRKPFLTHQLGIEIRALLDERAAPAR